MSGTMPSGEVFARLVGIPDGEWEYREFPCIFPVKNRPFYYVPTIKVHRGMTNTDLDILASRIDRIIEERLNQKGVIHSGSYWMADEIRARSLWGGQDGFMIHHRPGGLQDALEQFKAAIPPCTLVSPAIGRGVSFAGPECTYTIIGRIPWPDLSTEQMKARKEEDADYGALVSAIQIEQQAFRGLRGDWDMQQTFIFDDVWRWFRVAYGKFFSESFKASWETQYVLPAPMDLTDMHAYLERNNHNTREEME